MSRSRGGDKRSSWLTYQRRLFLIRRLMRGPAHGAVLIADARAELDDEIFPPDAAAALRHDIAALRDEFACEIRYHPPQGYLLTHLGAFGILDLPDEELDALAFLLNNVAESALPNAEHVGSLLDRVTSLLPEVRRRALETSTAHPHLDNPQPLSRSDAALVRRLKASLGVCEIFFRYHSPLNPGVSTHRVAPYNLAYRDGYTYLEAFCLECHDESANLEQRYVFYRLDRIVPGSFRRLPRQLPPGRPPRPVYRLRYWLAPALANRRDMALWFPDSQVTFEPDGAAIIAAQTSDLWLARQILLRYREFCRVLEPPELVVMMRTTLADLARLYDSVDDHRQEAS